jgi:hypothetical protein
MCVIRPDEVGVQRIKSLEDRILLQCGIAKRDIPMGKDSGPQELVEDRWHKLSEFQSKVPKYWVLGFAIPRSPKSR